MKIRDILLFLSCLASLLLAARFARAQQPAPAADVLLLRNGQEVRGRVLTITPTEVCYLPATDSAHPAALRPDTLRQPAAAVFLIRYANGTRELLAAPVPAEPAGPAALVGLSAAQRRQRGQLDARQYYHNSGPYWGAFGSTLYLGPVFGLIPTLSISSIPVKARNLNAPPLLLADANYAAGFRQQADRSKRGRAWAGYGTATGVYVVLVAALIASLGH